MPVSFHLAWGFAGLRANWGTLAWAVQSMWCATMALTLEDIMGNRCVITTAPYRAGNTGIYLHWNGGEESVTGILEACRELGYRSPEKDCYGWAAIAYAVGLLFRYDGLSVGVDTVKRLDTDNGDNGTWLIRDWEIVGNKHGARAPLDAADRAKADAIRDTIIARARAVANMP